MMQAPHKFKYIHSSFHPDGKNAYVTRINFFVGQYHDQEDHLDFPKPVTEKVAVYTVEAYLSTPLTKEFFERGFDGFGDWTEFNTEILSTENRQPIRGDLMGSNIYLEDLQKNGSTIEIFTGS